MQGSEAEAEAVLLPGLASDLPALCVIQAILSFLSCLDDALVHLIRTLAAIRVSMNFPSAGLAQAVHLTTMSA